MSKLGKSSKKYYMLVNPYIEGSINKVFKASNSLEAAKNAYETFSEYFNNTVKNFKFTLLKLKSEDVDKHTKTLNFKKYASDLNDKRYNDKNFSHFIVHETLNDKDVSFSIEKYENKNINNLNYLIKNISKIQKKYFKSNNKLSGGKKRDIFDDDDDDDDLDYFVKKEKYYYDPFYPINYWYYNPILYTVEPSDSYVYFPTFISPLSFPYVFDFNPFVLTTQGTKKTESVKLNFGL
jgi:hypothetical protein